MAAESGDWRNLAERMDDRRAELGMTWDEVAAAGGISVATLRRVRRGAPVTADNVVKIERGLKWPAGSVRSALAAAEAGMPTDPVSRARRASIIAATPEQLAEMYQLIDEVMGPERAREFLQGALELRAAHRPE
jgi:transcriptional regulator with XRE-family HTH domain